MQKKVEETTRAWSRGSSRSVQEDKLLDKKELTTSSSSSSCIDHTVLKLREEKRVQEAVISVLRGERDACEAHVESSLDLKTRLDKWEPKKWMSTTAARSATAGTSSSATTQSNVDLSTTTTLTLPSFEERQLVSVGTDVVISSSDGVTQVGGRHLVESCPTFLLADHADLVASDGWNLLSVSCTLVVNGAGQAVGADGIVVNGAGQLMKIKKDPSVVGVVKVDRRASSENENQGRHFNVRNGAVLVVEGLTLTGGYGVVRLFFSSFFAPVLSLIKNMWTASDMLASLLLLFPSSFFLFFFFSTGWWGGICLWQWFFRHLHHLYSHQEFRYARELTCAILLV